MPDWVFPARQGGLLEERNVRHVFKRLLAKAALRHIRIHDLRHTYASLLLQNAESVVYVKEQLGHASIQITVDIRPRRDLMSIAHLDSDVLL
jgi:integrase